MTPSRQGIRQGHRDLTHGESDDIPVVDTGSGGVSSHHLGLELVLPVHADCNG